MGFFTSRIELNAALAVILPLAVATKAWTAGPIVRVESEKNDASGTRFPFNGPFHNSRCRLDDLADSNRVAMRNAFQDSPAFGVFGPPF
jgi:hypothetical protein